VPKGTVADIYIYIYIYIYKVLKHIKRVYKHIYPLTFYNSAPRSFLIMA